MTNNVRLTFSVGDTTPGFTIALSKTMKIGDTKYNTWCSGIIVVAM